MANEFGDFVKARRRARGQSLRKFCKENKFNPVKLSKIERGVVTAPLSWFSLGILSGALKLNEVDHKKFMRLAKKVSEGNDGKDKK